MAAATDSLGRVMLLDVATLAVVCLWKVVILRARPTSLP
jgi:Rab3 GTPase-activating protein regulatory subunit N-terminus